MKRGSHFTKESKDKKGKFLKGNQVAKGNKSPKKGLFYEEYYGEKKAKEIKEKQKESPFLRNMDLIPL